MTCSPRLISKCWVLGIAAMLITLVPSFRAIAAIPVAAPTHDPVIDERERLAVAFRAQQSHEEKLKAGQERYNQRQLDRTKTAAAMTAQLEARRKVVEVRPTSQGRGHVEESVVAPPPHLIDSVLAISIGIILFGFYLNRMKSRPA